MRLGWSASERCAVRGDGFGRLIGQTIHQIEMILAVPALRNQSTARAVCWKLCTRPTALCRRGSRVLHADAGPRDPGILKGKDRLGRERARIDLDGDFTVPSDGKYPPQRVHHSGEIPGQQYRRGAPAPMHVHHAAAIAQMPADERNLVFEQISVGRHRGIFVDYGGMAAAVETELGAKRHVQIDRYQGVRRQFGQPFGVGRTAHVIDELHRRGIAGVAWNLSVRKLQMVRRHGDAFRVFVGDSSNHQPRYGNVFGDAFFVRFCSALSILSADAFGQ